MNRHQALWRLATHFTKNNVNKNLRYNALCNHSRVFFSGGVVRENKYDVVVVGGGVIGSSIACHLKWMDPSMSVCVLERDATYAKASTPLSAGSIRQQFSIQGNVEMSVRSMEFLRKAKSHLKISEDDVDVPDIQLVEGGYLFLASSEEGCDTLRKNNAVQREVGADVTIIEPDAIFEKFPWINVDDIKLGCFGHSGEGWFDPWALLMGFRRKAISMGVRYEETSCTSIHKNAKDIITAVRTANDNKFHCGHLVNAAGGWATEVCEMAGIESCPVRRRKRMIFLVHCPSGPMFDCPLVVDPSGVYFRREGSAGNFICGMSSICSFCRCKK